MHSPRLYRWLPVVALCCLPARLSADPFCCGGERGPTLVGDFNQAALVLLGTFTNPQGAPGNGTTDFAIEKVFKGGDLVGGKKILPKLPRYIPNARGKFLVFFDAYRGVIDPYRFVDVPTEDVAKYFTGAIAVKDRPVGKRLRYAFDYLNSADL